MYLSRTISLRVYLRSLAILAVETCVLILLSFATVRARLAVPRKPPDWRLLILPLAQRSGIASNEWAKVNKQSEEEMAELLIRKEAELARTKKGKGLFSRVLSSGLKKAAPILQKAEALLPDMLQNKMRPFTAGIYRRAELDVSDVGVTWPI